MDLYREEPFYLSFVICIMNTDEGRLLDGVCAGVERSASSCVMGGRPRAGGHPAKLIQPAPGWAHIGPQKHGWRRRSV